MAESPNNMTLPTEITWTEDPYYPRYEINTSLMVLTVYRLKDYTWCWRITHNVIMYFLINTGICATLEEAQKTCLINYETLLWNDLRISARLLGDVTVPR